MYSGTQYLSCCGRVNLHGVCNSVHTTCTVHEQPRPVCRPSDVKLGGNVAGMTVIKNMNVTNCHYLDIGV